MSSEVKSVAIQATAPTYRRDVDGLRAVAVLAVVLFHAFPSVLPGGFVGVDVFFVISGFLITGVLLRENVEGQVSLRSFYARRVKRIFPSLIVVLCFCLFVGWISLTSEEYQELGKYSAGGAAFLNNFMFWRAAGYFDTAADTKPLLHLWSLGIEEQFYLLWPIAILLIYRRLKFASVWPILFLGGVSLLYSLWLVRIDVVGAFYSPITRFWELISGGILAYWSIHRGFGQPKPLLAWCGLILIGAACAGLRSDYAFPGYWALLPVMGAVFLIAAGDQSWLNRHILASAPLVWIGLISYPLYLWHWPLLSFARILGSVSPNWLLSLSLIVVSFLLAWLTYRLVEMPIRFQSKSRTIVPALCLAMGAIFFVGHIININHGFGFRNYAMLNADPSTMVNGQDRSGLTKSCGVSPEKMPLFEWCIGDQKTPHRYAVLGDSKGESLFFGLTRESAPNMGGRMLGAVVHLAVDAPINHEAYASVEQDAQVKVVILANALRGLFVLDKVSGFINGGVSASEMDRRVQAYTGVIERMKRAGKRTVFVIDNPTLPDPNDCVSGGLTSSVWLNRYIYRTENRYCKLRYSDHIVGTQVYRQFVERLRDANPTLVIFDPTPLLCDIPNDVCRISENKKFLYSYGDHISDYAGSKLAKELLPVIEALVR